MPFPLNRADSVGLRAKQGKASGRLHVTLHDCDETTSKEMRFPILSTPRPPSQRRREDDYIRFGAIKVSLANVFKFAHCTRKSFMGRAEGNNTRSTEEGLEPCGRDTSNGGLLAVVKQHLAVPSVLLSVAVCM
jgi:hypothetical protein